MVGPRAPHDSATVSIKCADFKGGFVFTQARQHGQRRPLFVRHAMPGLHSARLLEGELKSIEAF